jgi:hypothetical protein
LCRWTWVRVPTRVHLPCGHPVPDWRVPGQRRVVACVSGVPSRSVRCDPWTDNCWVLRGVHPRPRSVVHPGLQQLAWHPLPRGLLLAGREVVPALSSGAVQPPRLQRLPQVRSIHHVIWPGRDTKVRPMAMQCHSSVALAAGRWRQSLALRNTTRRLERCWDEPLTRHCLADNAHTCPVICVRAILQLQVPSTWLGGPQSSVHHHYTSTVCQLPGGGECHSRM